MVVPSKEKADMDGSALLSENVTPKRRGRPRKSTLPSTPSLPTCTGDVEQNLTSNVLTTTKLKEETAALNDSTCSLVKETPKRRGRPKKDAFPPTPSSPLCAVSDGEKDLSMKDLSGSQSSRKSGRKSKLIVPEHDTTQSSCLDTPVSRGRGRKRKISSGHEDEAGLKMPTVKVKILSNVICGVCKKEMPEPNFTYHRYSNHYGLARLEGESQEFTEIEKAQELKKTFEKIKRLSCSKCSTSFTTLLGFQYHQKRCGVDASDIQNMLNECHICGKRVMSLTAHLKIHEKRAEKSAHLEVSAFTLTPSPGTKSKRVAAQKAATLLRELREEIADAPTQKPNIKAAKFFSEYSKSKVTNSIIVAWKKQIMKDSRAGCRFTSCPFSSDCIDKLKEHHLQCEIGLKSKAFACLKCDFTAPDRSRITQHVLSTHVSEKDDDAFELSGNSSSEDDTDEEVVGRDDDEYDSDNNVHERRQSIPQNTKTLDKAYGLSSRILLQFKSLSTSNVIPLWLAKFHKKNFTRGISLYKDWTPTILNFENLPSSYLPSFEESIPFACQIVTPSTLYKSKTDVIFDQLPRFQARLQNGKPIFFVGGSIQASSWCPMPAITDNLASLKRDQYLALSTFHEEYRNRSASEATFAAGNLVQIWNCGQLNNNSTAEIIPELDFCLVHDYGRIWSLVWCPSGCYDNKRLGLLAAACSDGTVRVFSVPNPSSLNKEICKPLYLRSDASKTLRLNTAEKSECTSLHWDSTLGHRFIVAGFANGIVALWDLATKSPLLLKDDTFCPVWSFYAHSSVVTGVSLSPHHNDARFIATASTDRTLKLWDRHDPAVPVSCSKRSRITDIKWRRHWPGVLVCTEDVYSLFRSASLFYDFGYTGNRQPLLPQNSVAWCSTENEYLDILAHATDAGEVVAYASHLAVIDCDDKKLRKQRILLLRTDLIDTSKENSAPLNRMNKAFIETSSKKATNLKLEISENPKYSLIFNDVTTNVVRTTGSRIQAPVSSASCETMDILRPCDKPLTSINKISFNPNFESHTWMCVCGENGLVQLIRIDSSATSRVADVYIEEMNSSNIDS